MKQEILNLLKEQGNLDELLEELIKSKTDAEILTIAHKIIAKKSEYGWLIEKVNALFKND